MWGDALFDVRPMKSTLWSIWTAGKVASAMIPTSEDRPVCTTTVGGDPPAPAEPEAPPAPALPPLLVVPA
jgi:hypothetical protein